MRWFMDRSLMIKLMSLVGVMLVVAVAITIVGAQGMSSISAKQQEMYDESLMPLVSLNAASIQFADARATVQGSTRLAPDEVDDTVTKMTETQAIVNDALAEFKSHASSPEAYQEIQAAFDGYFAGFSEQIVPALHAGDQAAAVEAAQGPLAELGSTLRTALTDEASAQSEQANGFNKEGSKTASQNTVMLWMVAGIGSLVAIVLCFVVLRVLTGSVASVANAARALAKGDLTVHPEVRYRDEIGVMAQAYTEGVVALSETLRGTAGMASGTASTANQLSTVALTVATESEEVSAQAGVVAAAAEQVSRNVAT
ncbi:MAG: MCP four helix bundle domain-containing protein, partial [Cellulomonas sp.]|nr:MCP four helix bundle domain-containing protein [Cellulomonas sp.]